MSNVTSSVEENKFSDAPFCAESAAKAAHNCSPDSASVHGHEYNYGRVEEPLHWWRAVPLHVVNPKLVAALRSVLASIMIMGEPGWPAAVAGDAAAAIGIALRSVRRPDVPPERLGCTASAVFLCAIAGDVTALLVLQYLRRRFAASALPDGPASGA